MSGKSSKTGTIFVKWLRCSRKSVLCVMNYNIAWQPRPSVGIPGDWCGSNSRAVDSSKVLACGHNNAGVTLVNFWTCSKGWFTLLQSYRRKNSVVVRDRRHSTWKIYHSQCGGSTIYSSLCTGHNDTGKWIALKVSPSPVLLTKCSFSSRGMCVVW